MLKSYLSKFGTLALLMGLAYGGFAQNLTVTAPAGIAGNYPITPALFGPAFSVFSGELVYADDGLVSDNDMNGIFGTIHDGCDPIMNDVTGKIALIDRGECSFVFKATEAQNAGAIAVIICNNNATYPYATQSMGGDDMGTLTIPAAMVSLATCETIKVELANGPVTVETVLPTAGEVCEMAIPAVEGVNVAPILTGGGSVLNTSASAIFYSFTPTSDALMTVSSCGDTVDTRMYILTDGCDVLTIVGQNDDYDFDNGFYCSETTVLVSAGTEYFIYWDDVWTNAGFTWTLTLGALPNTDVTFSVDIQNETVAPDGVKISINGGAEENMTDSGNGIWTYTASLQAGSDYTYLFSNGAGNTEDNPDLATCRTVSVGQDPVSTNLVCYNSCQVCPPDVACPNWIDDDFEAYTLGGISAQSPNWGPWTPNSTTEDGLVSNEFALSGAQALKISEANADDQLLLLGNRNAGHFILKWKMYIPTGSAGYYNMQKNQNTPGVGDAFANEVNFLADGTGTYAVGNNDIPFTYPQNEWFTVLHDIDLDNNTITVIYDGQLIAQHPANWQAGSQAGMAQLGAIDFYGAAGTLYYVDDVLLKEIEACPANALICDSYDGYDIGTLGPQSPWWTTWTETDGAVDDGVVSNEEFLSCEQAMKIENATGDDVILQLGNRESGNYTLSWDMYVPAGFGAYYNIQKDTEKLPSPVTTDFSIQVDMTTDGVATVDAGGTAAFTYNYPHDTWFHMEHKIDLDADMASVWMDGVMLYEYQPSWNIGSQANGYIKLGGVDFYGNTSNKYYVDNVLLIEEDPSVVPTIPVTFQVDMTWEIQQGMPVVGVKIAGNFTTNGATVPDWDPTMSPAFTSVGNDVWQTTIDFPASSAGQTLQYKFLNTATSWGDCGDEQECFGADSGNCTTGSGDFNRALVIPSTATTICYTYNTCSACNLPNATTEIVEIPMTIAPNPFSNKTIVTFNTPIVNGQARLTTMTGQMVRNYKVEGTQLTILKNELVPGIYFLNVVTEKGISAAEKLIVE